MNFNQKLMSLIVELKTSEPIDQEKHEIIWIKMAQLMLENEEEAASFIINLKNEDDLTWLSNCLNKLVEIRRSPKIINAFIERKKEMKDPEQINNINIDFEFADIYED